MGMAASAFLIAATNLVKTLKWSLGRIDTPSSLSKIDVLDIWHGLQNVTLIINFQYTILPPFHKTTHINLCILTKMSSRFLCLANQVDLWVNECGQLLDGSGNQWEMSYTREPMGKTLYEVFYEMEGVVIRKLNRTIILWKYFWDNSILDFHASNRNIKKSIGCKKIISLTKTSCFLKLEWVYTSKIYHIGNELNIIYHGYVQV